MEKRFTEQPIVIALRQAEAGRPISEIIHKMGVSKPTFSCWNKQYAGLDINEIRRLK